MKIEKPSFPPNFRPCVGGGGWGGGGVVGLCVVVVWYLRFAKRSFAEAHILVSSRKKIFSFFFPVAGFRFVRLDRYIVFSVQK